MSLGDPKESTLEYYADVENYIPFRISRIRSSDTWVSLFIRDDDLWKMVSSARYMVSENRRMYEVLRFLKREIFPTALNGLTDVIKIDPMQLLKFHLAPKLFETFCHCSTVSGS